MRVAPYENACLPAAMDLARKRQRIRALAEALAEAVKGYESLTDALESKLEDGIEDGIEGFVRTVWEECSYKDDEAYDDKQTAECPELCPECDKDMRTCDGGLDGCVCDACQCGSCGQHKPYPHFACC